MWMLFYGAVHRILYDVRRNPGLSNLAVVQHRLLWDEGNILRFRIELKDGVYEIWCHFSEWFMKTTRNVRSLRLLWDMACCHEPFGSRLSGGMYRLYLQVSKSVRTYWRSFESTVPYYSLTRCHIPEKRKILLHHRENLNTCKEQLHLNPSLKLKESAPGKEFCPNNVGYILLLIKTM
jgi:hypothetical protein